MTEAVKPAIDVMIPVAPKDVNNLGVVIESVLENSINPIENIHIIGASALRDNMPRLSTDTNIQWFNDEDVRPTPDDIYESLSSIGYDRVDKTNISWYFQKVLKLGMFDFLDTDSQQVLEVDADFTFIKPTEFVDREGRAQLAYGYPFKCHIGKNDHAIPESHAAKNAASRLLPDWSPIDAFSGMQHHMVFDRSIINRLTQSVEEAHDKQFWDAFFHSVETSKLAGISEFVLYRHFAHRNAPDRVNARHISSVDIVGPSQGAPYTLEQALSAPKESYVQAVGCHKFRDYRGLVQTMDYIPDDLRPLLLDHSGPLSFHLRNGIMEIAPLHPAAMPGDQLNLTLADMGRLSPNGQ
jgi:hypothetical protein